MSAKRRTAADRYSSYACDLARSLATRDILGCRCSPAPGSHQRLPQARQLHLTRIGLTETCLIEPVIIIGGDDDIVDGDAATHLEALGYGTVVLEPRDPMWIPMTDVRTRSLADRRVISRYGFTLVNRRHIVAATELAAGLVRGRAVL